MSALLFAFPGNEALAEALVVALNGEPGKLATHHFPDGESYVRLDTPVRGRQVLFVCSLDRPDEKLLALAFAADAARDQGATMVGVIAPYLSYMRQDKRFKPGEAVTAKSFAGIVSGFADWLVCVDPHLHRYKALSDIYSIPCGVARAAPAMAAWIAQHVEKPVIVGPDQESEQWATEVARGAGAPFTVLEKIRKGDRDVEISMSLASRWREHTPVLVDDIISTAGTMIATAKVLKQSGLRPPVCVGVHAVFAQNAYADLKACGAVQIVTCNTIVHPSNAIDVAPSIAEQVAALLN